MAEGEEVLVLVGSVVRPGPGGAKGSLPAAATPACTPRVRVLTIGLALGTVGGQIGTMRCGRRGTGARTARRGPRPPVYRKSGAREGFPRMAKIIAFDE